jgi:hypothetical protein
MNIWESGNKTFHEQSDAGTPTIFDLLTTVAMPKEFRLSPLLC